MSHVYLSQACPVGFSSSNAQPSSQKLEIKKALPVTQSTPPHKASWQDVENPTRTGLPRTSTLSEYWNWGFYRAKEQKSGTGHPFTSSKVCVEGELKFPEALIQPAPAFG